MCAVLKPTNRGSCLGENHFEMTCPSHTSDFGLCPVTFSGASPWQHSREEFETGFSEATQLLLLLLSNSQNKEIKRGASAQMCQSVPTCTPVKRGSFHSSACQPRRRQTHRSNCEATEGRKTSANSSDSSRRCQLAAPDTSIMTIINQQAANRLYLPQQLGRSAGRLTGGAGRDGSFGETVK